MSESEIVKLPIYFVFSRKKMTNTYSRYYSRVPYEDDPGFVDTSISVGKTKWDIVAHWGDMRCLDYVEFTRTCEGNLSEIKIEVELFLKINGSDSWREEFSNLLSETQRTLRITPECSTYFQTSDILEGVIIISNPEVLSPVTKQISTTTLQLSVDLLQMLENEDSFADFKLKCGPTEIPVHKCILSARSPVFDAMFKNKMKESQHGIVVIEDMQPNVLQAMLKYVYSGKCDNLTDVLADDLLFAAEKYQLKELKTICVNKLKNTTTVNNVVRVLVLGHLMDKGLEEHAKAFFCNLENIEVVENTEGWKSLLIERPVLAAEVLMAVVKNLQKY